MLRCRSLLTLSLVLATSSCAESKSSPPSLAGFSLGAAWNKVGRSVPCHSTPRSYGETLDVRSHVNVKWCEPAESVTLLFGSDTLIGVEVTIPASRDKPESIWRDRLSQQLTSLFGVPDSVITTVEPRS